ncbi:MAG: DUF805 domain-containing protein [Pseudomonadota bacterium]
MFDFLFNPSGRISRKGYGLGYLLPYLALVTLPGLFLASTGMVGLVLTLLGLFYLWPSVIAVPFKRYHDLGVSGWWHVLVIVIGGILAGVAAAGFMVEIFQDPEGDIATQLSDDSLTGLQQMALSWNVMADDMHEKLALIGATVIQYGEIILLLLLKGQSGENKYGNDPTDDGMGFAD